MHTAIGDSMTAGYGVPAELSYPAQLEQELKKRGFDYRVVNMGVSGDTTASALARIDSDVLQHNPRIVIVGLGGNDFLQGVPLDATERNLRSAIRAIHVAGAMVVLLGFRFPSLSASYETMYARVAKDERCLLIPDLLDGILSNPTLKSDEIHPNARGYALMAERIAPPVAKLLEKANDTR